MSVVKKYINTLKWIDSQLETVANQSVEANIDTIIMILQNTQLGQGLDSFGKDIVHPSKRGSGGGNGVPNYEDITESYYAKAFPPRKSKNSGDRYNMEWSGEFFDSMFVKVENYGFSILTKSGKKEFLESTYRTDLTRLTDKNNKEINDKIIIPAIYKFIFKNLFK